MSKIQMVNIQLDIEDWNTIALGLKDLADHLDRTAECDPEIVEDFAEISKRNRQLAAMLELGMKLNATEALTCGLDDLADLARIGSEVIIDGARWKVV